MNFVSPRTIEVNIVNAFVREGAGGNPAGVVLDADGLSDAEMMSIAAQVGLSETAFVSASGIATYKLDFFTPNRRIAHCGHATIATFSFLASINRVGEGEMSKETVDGPRRIIMSGDMAYMEHLAPKYLDSQQWNGVTEADVIASLGLQPGQMDPRLAPVVVNTGNNFLLVAVRSQADLRAIVTDVPAIERVSEALDLIGYYVFSTDVDGPLVATARMFGPRYSIPEEAATGMAAGPLACLLHDRLQVAGEVLLIEQGRFMALPSPSLLEARLALKNGRIESLMVGGRAKVMETRTVLL